MAAWRCQRRPSSREVWGSAARLSPVSAVWLYTCCRTIATKKRRELAILPCRNSPEPAAGVPRRLAYSPCRCFSVVAVGFASLSRAGDGGGAGQQLGKQRPP